MKNSIKKLLMEHEMAIAEHMKEINRLIHTNGEYGRCECCGVTFDPSDNVYGYCSEHCANSGLD